MVQNPLLDDWSSDDATPPFQQIKTEHFRPAFEQAMQEHLREIDNIASSSADPTFENVIVELEKCGRQLSQVASVFFNLSSAHTNVELQEIQRDLSPRLAKHSNEVYLNQKLFQKVNSLYERRDDLSLSAEEARVLERYAKSFLRSGAKLNEKDRGRVSEISQRLALLGTQFAQNVLKDEEQQRLLLKEESDLEGLPDFLVKSASRAALDLGVEARGVITLSRSSIEPFLQFSKRRDLREKAFQMWAQRGAYGGETDNRAIISETVKLRAEMANLLGFTSFTDYKLDNTMAKSAEAARELLNKVWSAARKKVDIESADLQSEMKADGINEALEPWDWRFYSEKVRKSKFDLDEAEIKPYFQLENMIQAAFHTAERLFGLSFSERNDCEVYHPDVRVWDVFDNEGKKIALFIGDYFARPSKQGGAWMSSFRSQEKLNGEITPIIVNVMNFVKGGEGEPSLLTYDDANTLFHEFGHALHGILSDVSYPSISGTAVARDFVELPSQLYEHWLSEPEILQKFAIHAKTGHAIPDELLQKILKARNFNQGFMATEYLSCAVLDLDIHDSASGVDDVDQFEKQALSILGMPKEVIMRHRLPHFLHLFAGDGYSAGYYSYMWSEVMDCDAFKAFEEAGNVFDKDVADNLKRYIYSSGGSMEPDQAYEAFRGRQPRVEALLEKRGFADL